MTQKRLHEIQSETEFDYEPVNVRLQNRYLHDVKASRRRYSGTYDMGMGFLILILFCAFVAGIMYLNSLPITEKIIQKILDI